MARKVLSKLAVFQAIALLALAMSLAACGTEPTATPAPQPTGTNATSEATSDSTSGKLNVIATTTQIRSMAQEVAGELAEVRSILPPGADAHEFEPKPSDVAAITTATLVLKNGVGLDAWLDRLIANAGGQHPVVTVSDGVTPRKGDEEEPGGDPHIWLDVTNAMTMTRNIRDALAQADPAHAAAYRQNSDAYLATLIELDKYIMHQIATIPLEDRKVVTNHDAFGYFFDRYGLTFVGSVIPSMSSGAQPSAADVADLITKIKEEKVKAIFLESSINPQLADQIAIDAGVAIVDTLYGDALGEPGTPGGTYEGMMRYNTDAIVEGLR